MLFNSTEHNLFVKYQTSGEKSCSFNFIVSISWNLIKSKQLGEWHVLFEMIKIISI